MKLENPEFYTYIVLRNGMKRHAVRMYRKDYVDLRVREMERQKKDPKYKDPVLEEFRTSFKNEIVGSPGR